MAALSEKDREAFALAYRMFERFWDIPDTSEAWCEYAGEIMKTIEGFGEDTLLLQELLAAGYETVDKRRAPIRKALMSQEAMNGGNQTKQVHGTQECAQEHFL